MNDRELGAAINELAIYTHGQDVLLCGLLLVSVEAIASLLPDPSAAKQRIVAALYDAVDGYSMPAGQQLDLERAKESARGTIDLLFSGARDESGPR